jgi:hypothetical protein
MLVYQQQLYKAANDSSPYICSKLIILEESSLKIMIYHKTVFWYQAIPYGN